MDLGPDTLSQLPKASSPLPKEPPGQPPISDDVQLRGRNSRGSMRNAIFHRLDSGQPNVVTSSAVRTSNTTRTECGQAASAVSTEYA